MKHPFAVTLDSGSSLANLTGSWRTMRPVYVDRLPPCNHACPAGENIQAWLYHSESGDYESAWRVLTQDNPMPAVMGRVCYHPCEGACNRAQVDETVGINSVERFLGDEAVKRNWRRKAPVALNRLVAEEMLDRIDSNRFVDLRPIAGALAWVIADPPHHGGHRVVLREHAPGTFVVARFRLVEPRLDVFAGRTGMIARRQAVHIDRTHGAPGAGEIGEAAAAIERDGERVLHPASSSGSSSLNSVMLRSAMACSRASRCEPAASLNKCSKRRCGLRYSATGTGRRIFRLLVTMPYSASKTGNSPDSTANRARRTVSCEAEPQPSGHGT